MNKEGHEMVADLNLRIQDLSEANQRLIEANQRLEQEVKTLRNERNAVLDRNRELHKNERTLKAKLDDVKEEAEKYEKMIQQLYDHQEGPLLVGKVKLSES